MRTTHSLTGGTLFAMLSAVRPERPSRLSMHPPLWLAGKSRRKKRTQPPFSSPCRGPGVPSIALAPLPLLSYPLRLTLLHESADAFLSVRRLHQFFEINLLRSCKTFVEVHGVPGVRGFLSQRQRGWTQFAQRLQGLIDHGRE